MMRKISELFDLLLTTVNLSLALASMATAFIRYSDGQPWEFHAFMCIVNLQIFIALMLMAAIRK